MEHFEIIVVGGGPAGLAAGTYTTTSGVKTLVIEADKLGGSVPPDPWSERWSHVQKMIKEAGDSGVSLHAREEMIGLDAKAQEKEVKTTRDKYSCDAVILAMGSRSQALGGSGEGWLGRGISYCAQCDGDIFTGKDVIVLGLGHVLGRGSPFKSWDNEVSLRPSPSVPFPASIG